MGVFGGDPRHARLTGLPPWRLTVAQIFQRLKMQTFRKSSIGTSAMRQRRKTPITTGSGKYVQMLEFILTYLVQWYSVCVPSWWKECITPKAHISWACAWSKKPDLDAGMWQLKYVVGILSRNKTALSKDMLDDGYTNIVSMYQSKIKIWGWGEEWEQEVNFILRSWL